MLQIEAGQWVGSEIKGEAFVGNKALLDPLIVRKFMFLVITVLLDAIV